MISHLYLPLVWVIFHVSQLCYCRDLYSPTDDVTIASIKSLNDSVQHAFKDYLVEFYSSHCGHCINYAPKFKAFATSIKEWKPLLEILVFDCTQGDNYKHCSAAEVKAYPTLKYYPRGHRGFVSQYEATRDLSNLRADLVRLMLTHSNNPLFRPIDGKKWTELGLPKKYIYLSGLPPSLAVEAILHFAGRQSLPFLWSNQTISSSRVNITRVNSPVDITSSVYKFNGVPNQQELFAALEGQFRVWEVLSTNAQINAIKIDSSVNTGTYSSVSSPSLSNLLPVHAEDIYSTLTKILYHEVGLHQYISGDALEALRQFMHVLVQVFPGAPSTMKSLRHIEENLKNKQNISHFEWTRFVEDSNFPIINDKWVTCRGSQPYFRRFPCGLWTLFHSLTVSEWILSSEAADQPKSSRVLNSMKSFVKHFFSCRDCSRNFENESRSMASEVNGLRSAMLWLWRTHNRVNLRLKGDASEDPEHPKYQFPNSRDCGSCVQGQEWSEDEVLKFLVKHYRVSSWIMDPEFMSDLSLPIPQSRRSQILQEKNQENPVRSGNIMLRDTDNTFSVNTILSYVLFSSGCTLLVIAGYCLYRRRLYRGAYKTSRLLSSHRLV